MRQSLTMTASLFLAVVDWLRLVFGNVIEDMEMLLLGLIKLRKELVRNVFVVATLTR